MLVTGSIGTRLTADHVVAVVDVLYTMSFDEQFVRKRQSGHITYTLPPASTADEIRPALIYANVPEGIADLPFGEVRDEPDGRKSVGAWLLSAHLGS